MDQTQTPLNTAKENKQRGKFKASEQPSIAEQ